MSSRKARSRPFLRIERIEATERALMRMPRRRLRVDARRVIVDSASEDSPSSTGLLTQRHSDQAAESWMGRSDSGLGGSQNYTQIRIDIRAPLARITERDFVKRHVVLFEFPANVQVSVNDGDGAKTAMPPLAQPCATPG